MKNYTHAIITDGDGKPMAWSDTNNCLAYCTSFGWRDEPHPVVAYTIAKSIRLIHKSTEYRKKQNLQEVKYQRMPFLNSTK